METYITDKKELYSDILDLLEYPDIKYDAVMMIKIEKRLNFEIDHEEMEDFLQIIKDISDNHHRNQNFIKRINQILQFYKDKIKQTLSNFEIFNIFESNKMILLLLLKNKIVTISETIYNEIMNKYESNDFPYFSFFIPEIENFIGTEKIRDIKNELLLNNPNLFENYEQKRQEGENDSYICSLIRNDSVEEFISYVNRRNISLSSQITPSIYETNSFLIENKNTTLIEYSAFYGSIQIFQYLMINNVELTPSLWLYTIHSKNADLIHLLESNYVKPPKFSYRKNKNPFDNYNEELEDEEEEEEEENSNVNDYLKCFIESIKCHHNDIAIYIKNNLLLQNEQNQQQQQEEIISACIKYHNYSFFQIETIYNSGFFYLCLYHYNDLVKLLLKEKGKEIESKIIEMI